MTKPLISIISPVYQSVSHLEACIRNVSEQNCPLAEHIIMDGGSTDGTVELLKKLSQTVPRLRWVSEKDGGQSQAMNRGIARAEGKVIGMLMADDTYEPGTLNRITEIFKDLPEPSFAVGNARVFKEGNPSYLNKPRNMKLKQLLRGFDVYPFPVNPVQYFYHKTLHELTGPYSEEDHFNMDIIFLLTVVQKVTPVYFDEVWGNYYLAPGCKTFERMKAGTLQRDVDRVMRSFRKNLSGVDRMKLNIHDALKVFGVRL